MSAGARIRTDIVDVYVFRAGAPTNDLDFLQLRRARAPMQGDWHPVMGHMREGETALACAIRELAEEVSLDARSDDALGLWQLEQVHPFFLAEQDAVVLSPRFAIQVNRAWSPSLNGEHDAHRWTAIGDIDDAFRWPGQRACCREVAQEIVAKQGYPALEL